MNLSYISKITLSTLVASIGTLTITPSVSALTWTVSGTFDDGGTVSGTFDYDEINDIYTNVNITTFAGSNILFSGTTYTDDASLFGNADEFTITDDTVSFDLTLVFDTS